MLVCSYLVVCDPLTHSLRLLWDHPHVEPGDGRVVGQLQHKETLYFMCILYSSFEDFYRFLYIQNYMCSLSEWTECFVWILIKLFRIRVLRYLTECVFIKSFGHWYHNGRMQKNSLLTLNSMTALQTLFCLVPTISRTLSTWIQEIFLTDWAPFIIGKENVTP